MNPFEFQMIEKIGRGGYAEVWRAIGPDGEQCAVKLPLEAGPMFVDAMRDEIAKFRQLAGAPGVIKLLHYELEGPLPYLVMELADGNLLDLLQLPLEGRAAATLGVELVRAIQEAHLCGVIHRDVKPANLLLKHGRLRVADFGLGKGFASVLLTFGGAGTPGYMAPEQKLGPAGTAADVYGIGATLFHLLTGVQPPDDQDALDVRWHVLCEARLAQLVVRMTAVDPRRRPTLGQVLLDLSAILQPVPRRTVATQSPSPLVVGGGLAAAVLAFWAFSGRNSYDRDVGRYRGSDGTFRSGRFG